MSIITNAESAYVILVNDDNTITTTQKRRIMQRSKLVDDLWFLVNPTYNGFDMRSFTVLLEYVLPISKRYRSEILTLSNEVYNGHLKYLLPFDTTLTQEAGDIELSLTFLCVELDEDGKATQRVRKVSGTTISITPITAWSDIIPDDALTALDQRIIMTDAQIRALNELSNALADSKADNLKYDEKNNELQLTAGGREIGDKVVLNTNYESIKDGIPAVDFSVLASNPDSDAPEKDLEDNVVEF